MFSGNVSVPEGETTTYNIHLERTATGSPWIIGYVKDGDTRSPISQATISVTGLECNCSYTTLTNKDGYYEIELDLAGNYTVRVEKEGYESQSVKAYAAEGSEEYVGFYLEKTGTRLKGHVWEGETRGGGIKDVKIRIESANESYIVYTDLNGYYEKEISQGGEYTITASKEGYLSQTKSIIINEGEEKIVDFYLYPDTVVEDTLFLRENFKLSPEVPNESPAETIHVEAQYEDHIVGRTNRQWVDVGAWTSSPMTQNVILKGEVTFTIWFQVTESGYNADPDWEFVLSIDGFEIASAEVVNSAESNEQPIEITASTSVSSGRGSGQVTVPKGDTISLVIRYRGWEDATVHFGNITYDSGVTVQADPGFTEKPARERYQVQLTASKYSVNLEGKNRTVISLTIENTGLEEDSYTLTAAGTYKGWKITWDYTETITIAPGRAFVMNMTLSEDLVESPDGDTILVEVVVRSETYADVYDSVRIEGKLEETNGIPDLTIPLIAASLTVGALVASFRRRF